MRYLAATVLFLAACLPGPARASDGGDLNAAVAHLADRWAVITYQTHDQAREREAMTALADEAEKLVTAYPQAAEPLIWDGIIKYSVASYVRGLKGFGLVKQAKDLFEKALEIDPKNSAALCNLGFLYYQVPGFPIGFGSDKSARQYLEQALAITPDDIDANYFYGDFLVHRKEYAKASDVLKHALQAPTRPGFAAADKGRRDDIRDLLAEVEHKLGHDS
jgi:tetratricopeptide (TPR) repeat protein